MAFNSFKHRRRSIRLKDYDYASEGLYFITIVCHDRKHLFGEIIDGEIQLNEYGKIAEKHWLNTPDLRPNVSLGEHVIMPNHIHGIISIDHRDESGVSGKGISHSESSKGVPPDDSKGVLRYAPTAPTTSPTPPPTAPTATFRSPSKTIGAIVRGYKAAVTTDINILRSQVANNPDGGKGVSPSESSSSKSVSSGESKGVSSGESKGVSQYAPTASRATPTKNPVWQRNFYDNIIRDQRAYENISAYILNNPSKWEEDRFSEEE